MGTRLAPRTRPWRVARHGRALPGELGDGLYRAGPTGQSLERGTGRARALPDRAGRRHRCTVLPSRHGRVPGVATGRRHRCPAPAPGHSPGLPRSDFTGGEFVVTEQRPRMQSRATVLPLRQGDAVLFSEGRRPVRNSLGQRYGAGLKHGTSRVRSGQRLSLSWASRPGAEPPAKTWTLLGADGRPFTSDRPAPSAATAATSSTAASTAAAPCRPRPWRLPGAAGVLPRRGHGARRRLPALRRACRSGTGCGRRGTGRSGEA